MEIEMPPSSRLLRFSTEMLPERERVSAFREEFARRVLTMDAVDRSGGRPRIEITFMPLGVAAVSTLVATPTEFIRHKHHLKDGNDDFHVEIIATGPIQFAHAGAERTYDTGSAVFIDRSEEHTSELQSHSD